MKLIAEIEDEQNEINIKREDNKVFAEIGERKYELEMTEPEPNVYLLKHNNKIYNVFISHKQIAGELQKVKVGTQDFEINLIDPKKLLSSSAGSDLADGIVELKTAMPGKVVRILLKENAEVKSGEGVIIVEAMKMQNEMKSPKDGIIKEIKFNEGDTVNSGDVLVIIE
jgi:biotin carboxyl carrier protein